MLALLAAFDAPFLRFGVLLVVVVAAALAVALVTVWQLRKRIDSTLQTFTREIAEAFREARISIAGHEMNTAELIKENTKVLLSEMRGEDAELPEVYSHPPFVASEESANSDIYPATPARTGVGDGVSTIAPSPPSPRS